MGASQAEVQVKNFVLLTAAVAGGNQTLFMMLARGAFQEAAQQVSCDDTSDASPCSTDNAVRIAATQFRPTSSLRYSGTRVRSVLRTGHFWNLVSVTIGVRWTQIMQSQSTGRRLQAVLGGGNALLQQSGVLSTTAAAISAAIDTVNGFAGAAADTEAIETVSYVTQAKVRPQL